MQRISSLSVTSDIIRSLSGEDLRDNLSGYGSRLASLQLF